MNDLKKQVSRAKCRLAVRRFLNSLTWCWSGTLAVALVLVLAGKFRSLGIDDWVWIVGALCVGMGIAAIWAWLAGRGMMGAAVEIDRQFGLQERVSSAVSMPQEQGQTDIGRALIDDATHKVSRIDIGERLAVLPGRRMLIPLMMGLLVVLVSVCVSPTIVASPHSTASKQAIEKSSKSLHRKLVRQRKKAKEKGLKDAELLFKRLEKGAKELSENTAGDRKKALVKLNDLAKELKQRRRQLGGAERIKRQFGQLDDFKRGPAQRFADAVRRGDFERAGKELESLKRKLLSGKLGDAEKRELAEQLDRMRQNLEKLADACKDAQNDLQRRLEQAKKNGTAADVEKLQQQLDNLMRQRPHMEQVDQLAKNLKTCSDCMKAGRLDEAAKAIGELQAEFDDLQNTLSDLEMVDDVMKQLDQARAQMNCQKCNGSGCRACQLGAGGGGLQAGHGRGMGIQPETSLDANFYDSRVRQKVGKGTARVVDLVDGPNVKGRVEQQIKQQFDAAKRQQSDPLTGQRMPRKHRSHAKEYFDRLRDGQ